MGQLDGIRDQLIRKAATAARATASDLESRLRVTSPVDTGNMRQHTTARAFPSAIGARIDIKVDTDYAHIVRHGQRPHTIRPRRQDGVLAFSVGGRQVFTRYVNHPGAQPRTWFDDAMRDAPDILARNWHAAR